jgi:hypothetical protein
MNVPRLTLGKGWLGPEALGCCGTGTRPAIYRSRATGKYVVGPENDCDYVLQNWKLIGSNKRIHKVPYGRTVWVFKTRKPAVAKFAELCEERKQLNERLRKDYLEEQQQLRKMMGRRA